jgi:hypothetical protein
MKGHRVSLFDDVVEEVERLTQPNNIEEEMDELLSSIFMNEDKGSRIFRL